MLVASPKKHCAETLLIVILLCVRLERLPVRAGRYKILYEKDAPTDSDLRTFLKEQDLACSDKVSTISLKVFAWMLTETRKPHRKCIWKHEFRGEKKFADESLVTSMSRATSLPEALAEYSNYLGSDKQKDKRGW